MRSPAPGHLIVYRALSSVAVGRVDMVRERSLSAFPWRQGDRRWDRRLSRVDRRDVLAVLSGSTDPAPIADQFNVLVNRRAAEKAAAQRLFDERVKRVVSSLDGVS